MFPIVGRWPCLIPRTTAGGFNPLPQGGSNVYRSVDIPALKDCHHRVGFSRRGIYCSLAQGKSPFFEDNSLESHCKAFVQQEMATRRDRAAKADASPTGVMLEDCSGGYVRVVFAAKPERDILDALKAAGFCGPTDRGRASANRCPRVSPKCLIVAEPDTDGRRAAMKPPRLRFTHEEKILLWAVAIILAFILLPIAAAGQTSADTATVTFYRVTGPFDTAIHASIYVDGQRVAKLPAGRFLTIQLPAGEHTFAGDDPATKSAPLMLVGGETLYFAVHMEFRSVWSHGRYVLDLVTPEEGGFAVHHLKPEEKRVTTR